VSLVAYAEDGQIIGGVSVPQGPIQGKFLPCAIAGPAKLTDAGTYWVVVTGPTGSTKSDEVTLTVEAP
jgi:hypothetical protein